MSKWSIECPASHAPLMTDAANAEQKQAAIEAHKALDKRAKAAKRNKFIAVGRAFVAATVALCFFLLAPAARCESFTQVGTYVAYGKYEQDNDTSNGAEAIEWLVLDCDSATGKSLLISRYGLDAEAYHHDTPYPTWEKSDIRAWLNDDFLNAAFSASEQKGIVLSNLSTPDYNGNDGGADTQDKVFLLSYEEATLYFSTDEARQATLTAYAAAQGAYRASSGYSWWWLRSPGSHGDSASFVSGDGSFDYYAYVDSTGLAVRPAFWFDPTAL